MLVLRRISVKKLAIYISIIIVMVGGSGFMLYQNKKLTSPNPVVSNPPAVNSLLMNVETVVPADQAETNQPATGNKTLNQPLNMEKIKSNGGLDLTIFDSEKFKALQENIIIPAEQIGVGKRNPFKPN